MPEDAGRLQPRFEREALVGAAWHLHNFAPQYAHHHIVGFAVAVTGESVCLSHLEREPAHVEKCGERITHRFADRHDRAVAIHRVAARRIELDHGIEAILVFMQMLFRAPRDQRCCVGVGFHEIAYRIHGVEKRG